MRLEIDTAGALQTGDAPISLFSVDTDSDNKY